MFAPEPIDIADMANARALAELSRMALACLVRQAGGRIVIPPAEWSKLPNGELSAEFGDDGGLELVYTQREAREWDHAAPSIAGPSDGRLANHIVCHLAVSILVAQNGGRIKLSGLNLADVMRLVGAMRFEPTLDGGYAFYTIEGGTH